MRLTRLTLVIIALIILVGFNLLVRKQLADVEPQLFQATEEVMVDAANIFAAFAERQFTEEGFDTNEFQKVIADTGARRIHANIYHHTKRSIGLDVYVTDHKGKVLYDSGNPQRAGEDFSRFRDVYLTLRGQYGARSTRIKEEDEISSDLHVAALIGSLDDPLGVLTVYKNQSDALPIIRRRISEIWWGAGLIGGGILFCVWAVFIWQYRPIAKLTKYARDIEKGLRKPLPYLGLGKEVNTLAKALESMRISLEGRQYAQRYVQTLSHEMKSPLAGIRGAAELLYEDFGMMTDEDRRKFLQNLSTETNRADRLLSQLLELSIIEGKIQLEHTEMIDLNALLRSVSKELASLAELAGVRIILQEFDGKMMVHGDSFILKSAFTNLLDNAIDYSPRDEDVLIKLKTEGEIHIVMIHDRGEGVPEYAKEKVFDRFFSLRHLRTGKKGTGLGLTLVREAAQLHFGNVVLESNEPSGTCAIFKIPRA